MRFCAFSYSTGEPCGRSDQLSMYFKGTPLFELHEHKTDGAIVSSLRYQP
jgi:hypothetical protein